MKIKIIFFTALIYSLRWSGFIESDMQRHLKYKLNLFQQDIHMCVLQHFCIHQIIELLLNQHKSDMVNKTPENMENNF